MSIKLLLADVDGTLVTHEKALTERARAAIVQLGAAGIRFAITSGRPPRGMQMLIEPLYLTTPIAALNGGMFAAQTYPFSSNAFCKPTSSIRRCKTWKRTTLIPGYTAALRRE